MNLLFLTLVKINSLQERGIYQDLLNEFVRNGYNVTVVSPLERRENKPTRLLQDKNVKFLQVKTFNLQKTNVLEKGIGTLAIESQFLAAIKKYLPESKFDVVLYSTPPITFSKVIEFIKKRDGAKSYLLLKDIFPQNAVDLKMMKKNGLIHKFFRHKEEKLYKISDFIGCMSPANVDFLLKHNPSLANKVEVNPNSINPEDFTKDTAFAAQVRKQYNLPLDKKIFIYGGNLGKPQGIDFLMDVLGNIKNDAAHFVVVGSGTEYPKIQKWFGEHQPKNATLLKGLPKNDFDNLLKASDIGLIFLHPDFTIPNFPSRLLSYLEYRLPVIAATDTVSDIGTFLEDYRCGSWVKSGDLQKFAEITEEYCAKSDVEIKLMGDNGRRLLEDEFSVEKSFKIIDEKLR